MRIGILAWLVVWAVLSTAGLAGPSFAGEDADLLNPLREHYRFRHLRPFARELREFVEARRAEAEASEVAVYFRSLNDGVWLGVGERTKFAPASLMKVPVMMIFFKAAEDDPSVLERRVPYKKWSTYSQYAPPAATLEEGATYTVDELIRAMIEHSDNDAFRSLLPHLPIDAAEHLYRQLGYSRSFKERGDFLSLKTYTGTLRVLYNATYLNEEMSAKALGYLAGATFEGGLAGGLPSGVRIAHKFGEYQSPEDPQLKQFHDIGIVYHPQNPYLIGVMTRGKDYEKLSRVIREISAFIYREVDAQYSAGFSGEHEYDFEEEA